MSEQAPPSSRGSISVLILSYNRPALLPRMLESVLRQTRQPMEILILDNASSPDVKAGIVDHLSDPRIRWEGLAENIGPIANFGRAFGLARGDYVTVLHDDDLVREDFLEMLGGFLDREPSIGTVTCRGQPIREDGSAIMGAGLIGPEMGEPVRIYRGAGDVALEYARDRCLIFGATLYRRSVAGQIPHRPEFGKVIDVIYFCELAQAGSVACLGGAPYFVRSHGGQDSASFSDEALEKLDRYFLGLPTSSARSLSELRWRLSRRMTYRALAAGGGWRRLLARAREPGFEWRFALRYFLARFASRLAGRKRG